MLPEQARILRIPDAKATKEYHPSGFAVLILPTGPNRMPAKKVTLLTSPAG